MITKTNLAKLFLTLTAVAFLSGCAVGRRTLSLDVPRMASAQGDGPTIAVTSVEDSRHFENKPSSPSTPSVDGDIHAISEAEKSRIIGRQRNSYGMAMGDIGLEEGESINQKTQELLEEGLKSRGYQVGEGLDSDYKVDVIVEDFWAWFTPGMWTISFEARIRCKVTVSGESRTEEMDITGYGKNKGQVGSDANWKLAYERAFTDFLLQFDKALEAKGL